MGFLGFFWSYVSKVCIKLAPGRGLYGSLHKIGLAEPKKSLHKATFCQNTPLRGLSGVLLLPTHIRIDFHMQMKICKYKYCNFKGCSVALLHHISTTSHPGHSWSPSYHRLPWYQHMPPTNIVLIISDNEHALF